LREKQIERGGHGGGSGQLFAGGNFYTLYRREKENKELGCDLSHHYQLIILVAPKFVLRMDWKLEQKAAGLRQRT